METESSTSFNALLREFHEWRLKEFPEYATTADCHIYNHRLETLSLEKFDEYKIKAEEFLGNLQTIEKGTLGVSELDSHELLENHLRTIIEGYRWRYHSACNPVSFLENTHINFKSFLIDATPFKTKEDFLGYVKRLEIIPIQVSEQIILMREAMTRKTTLHRLSVERVPEQLTELLEVDMEEHPFYEPCTKYINGLDGIYIYSFSYYLNIFELYISFFSSKTIISSNVSLLL